MVRVEEGREGEKLKYVVWEGWNLPAQVEELARNQKKEVTSSRMREKLTLVREIKIDKVWVGVCRYVMRY